MNNKRLVSSAVVVMLSLGGYVAAGTIYTAKDYALDICAGSPPALIFVTDSYGNKTGADPLKGLDNLGRGTIIQQIPSAWVEQQNTESDAVAGTFVPNSSTSWDINIPDQGASIYTVNLVGVSTGVAEVSVNGVFFGKQKNPRITSSFDVLIYNGQSKQIRVFFDPASRSLTTTAIIKNGDFVKDTQEACGLGDVSSHEACEALEAIAANVEKEKSKGNVEAEEHSLKSYLSILNRLHNWGKDGFRQDWDDFKVHSECDGLRQKGHDGVQFFAKDPSYSALKLDAETLLKALPADHNDRHDRDHAQDGDR